jgi:predicted nucleotidyltransferase component of viral defense system
MIDYNQLRRLREKFSVPEETIEKDYLIELMLDYIASDSVLNKYFVFRGGTAIKKIYFPEFRYSEDLDFIVKPGNHLRKFGHIITNITERIREQLPLELDVKQILSPQQGHLQIFLAFDIVSEIRTVKELKIDIVEDRTLLRSKERMIVFIHDDFRNLNHSLNTYDLESMAAEKIVRIMDVVDEPRDLWDLFYLLKSKIKSNIIKEQFVEKTGFDINAVTLINAIKKPNYQRTWEMRLKHQISLLPEYRSIIHELTSLIHKSFGKPDC